MKKYPRTPHLSYSLGRSPDDIPFSGDLDGKPVVITEKMDGECTTLTCDCHHARSLDSRYHPSRSQMIRLWAAIRHEIPPGYKVIGETVSAKHSICYSRLPGHFLVFAVTNDNYFLSWEETELWAELLGLPTVPVLGHEIPPFLHARMFTGKSKCGGEQEGYVVRVAGAFKESDFGVCVAKYVRANHVQTDEHWMKKPVEWNGIELVR